MDFRLKVFVEVAKHLNFTRAAKELFISQPAITKHIQELESMYKVPLFERSGGKIALTHQGSIFLKHANEILGDYKVLENEMELLSGHFSGELKIGASTTIAQYLIAPLIAGFIKRFPRVKCTLFTGNSEQVENALETHIIDLGLVEGSKRKQNLKYTHFAKDELVLVTGSKTSSADNIPVAQMKALPLVLREGGSGTLEVIEKTLQEYGIKLQDLNILLQIGCTEGIKRFLASMEGSYAVVSVISVIDELKQNILKVVDIEETEFVREFAFVTRQGEYDERVMKFMSFAALQYPITFSYKA